MASARSAGRAGCAVQLLLHLLNGVALVLEDLHPPVPLACSRVRQAHRIECAVLKRTSSPAAASGNCFARSDNVERNFVPPSEPSTALLASTARIAVVFFKVEPCGLSRRTDVLHGFPELGDVQGAVAEGDGRCLPRPRTHLPPRPNWFRVDAIVLPTSSIEPPKMAAMSDELSR